MATININNDNKLVIATGVRLNSKNWKNVNTTWKSLLERLSNVTITQETHAQFMACSKDDQAKIKDAGGFVGGMLLNGKRNKSSVSYRQLLTLDIDYSYNDFWWDFTMLFSCAAAIHSTHKHTPEKPRHRLIIPLNREVTSDEYEPIARYVAGAMNIELFDQTTYETNRFMFWPTMPKDVDYYFEYQDGLWLDADAILNSYVDWHNINEWPKAISSDNPIKIELKKQEDPLSKAGIIGYFCRAYSIQDAINTFLSDVYEETVDGRFTYTRGSTAAGLVIYEDKFAYSHHSTDPISGKLCNSFDLVRIHLFGFLDDDKVDSTKSPSFKKMENFAANDEKVKKLIITEKFSEAKLDFQEPVNLNPEEVDTEWAKGLEANRNGEYENSAPNINLILKNDPVLKGVFAVNWFDNRRYLMKSLPWHKLESGEPEPVRDLDYSGVRNYIECVYNIVSSQKIDDAIAIEVERNGFHPIRDYIKGLTWDRKKRIDTLLIDYFGAENSDYTKQAIRKSLCAAVARVFEPGKKFDMVLILVGPQGTYKSTFIRKLGLSWFSDTFTTVQGKEAYEQLQGAWIIEMAELSALKKSEAEGIKQFISKCEDSFRPAYARTVEVYKRQCVFFGTTNSSDFLKDPTGNRRFNPVDINPAVATKSVASDMTPYEVNQIWAEAYQLYLKGEDLYFDTETTVQAKKQQANHSAVDERRGIIEDFIEKLLPENWEGMDVYDRRSWLDDPLAKKGTVERDVVCIAEIWCECLHKEKNDMSRYNTHEINDILRELPGWEFVQSTKTFRHYGKQKYYRRIKI